MKISAADLHDRLLPILCAQGIGLACGLVGVKLTSHLVDPTDYGAYGVFVSLASVGVGVVYAGLVKFLSRHWQTTEDGPGLLREILVAATRKSPWLLAAAAGLGLVSAHHSLYALLFLGSALGLALTQFAQSALQAAREHWRDLGVSAGGSLARSFLPPLLYVGTGAGLIALLAGFCLQAWLGALLGAWALRRWWPRGSPHASRPTLTPIYEGPRFVILALAGWMLAGVNRWIVAGIFGPETAGYFNLAVNLGAILPSIAGMVLLQLVQPRWFAADVPALAARRALLREVDLAALVYTVIGLLLATSVHGLMPWLIGPLVSAAYRPAAEFVAMAGSATVAATVGLYYHAMLLAARRERDCTAADLSGGLCLILGGIAAAAVGMTWFKAWLLFSPLVPWGVNRTLARRALLRN